MACFMVPVAEAIVVSALNKNSPKSAAAQQGESALTSNEAGKIPFTRKLKWLSSMLWGGAALLAFEHLWHGEIVPWFPFLTAMSDRADAAEMFHEMATVGVTMALLVTAVWGVMCIAADAIAKRPVPVKSENSAS